LGLVEEKVMVFPTNNFGFGTMPTAGLPLGADVSMGGNFIPFNYGGTTIFPNGFANFQTMGFTASTPLILLAPPTAPYNPAPRYLNPSELFPQMPVPPRPPIRPPYVPPNRNGNNVQQQLSSLVSFMKGILLGLIIGIIRSKKKSSILDMQAQGPSLAPAGQRGKPAVKNQQEEDDDTLSIKDDKKDTPETKKTKKKPETTETEEPEDTNDNENEDDDDE
jgi:hypothetical protein